MYIDNNSMTDAKLAQMRQEKGKICISIIIPTHRLSPERRTDQLPLERAIERAKNLLQTRWKAEETGPVVQALDQLCRQVDFIHNQEGLGLFVSARVQYLVPFPFPVAEKVVVADHFELRDVLFKMSYSWPYLVLQLTEEGARLYRGELKTIEEIQDQNFPHDFKDDYEYQPPSRGSSYTGNAFLKSYEQDKSTLEKTRYRSMLQKVDELLKEYLEADTPVIILGVKQKVATFMNLTEQAGHIAGVVPGSYSHNTLSELADLVWPVVRSHIDGKKKDEISAFNEKTGENLTETGIQNVWQAVAEGRGLRLLVEKDFRLPGFIIKDPAHLYLHPPEVPHTMLGDAVDDLIEMTLDKQGTVVFVDEGMLKNQQRIALITRY